MYYFQSKHITFHPFIGLMGKKSHETKRSMLNRTLRRSTGEPILFPYPATSANGEKVLC